MTATESLRRPPAWFLIGSIAVCLLLSLAGGLRGHLSTAVWFAALAVLNGWFLLRRPTADRPPPQDLSQMRRRAILTELAIAGSGVAMGILFLIRSVQTSGGDRFTSGLLTFASFGLAAWIFIAVWLFVRRNPARVDDN